MFRISLWLILCIIFGIESFVLPSQDLYDKVRYTVSWVHFPSTVCREIICVLSPWFWEASDKTQPGSLDRWERKPGNEVALKAQNPHFQSNTIPDKTTWERFSLNAHCHTQQNYFQSNWFAEPNPLPPGPSCFLQTFKDQGCFTRHNNFTSKGRGEWKNRYSYDF